MLKNIGLALGLSLLSFIFLNLAFVLDYVFQITIIESLNSLIPKETLMSAWYTPPLLHILYIILIGFITYQVYKRPNLSPFIKATYLTVPVSIVYTTIGILGYSYPILSFIAAAASGLYLFFYLRRHTQNWLYYWALIFISILMLLGSIFQVQI